MLRAGALLLVLLLLAGAPAQAAIRVLGSMDPIEAGSMPNYGIEVQNQLVSSPLVGSTDPDVLVVTTEVEVSPQALLSHLKEGRGAVVSNHIPATYFEGLGIKRGGIQLVNIQSDPKAPVVISFPGLAASTVYQVRVYWPAASSPDTLYSLEAIQGTFDVTRSYSGNIVIAGMAVGKGYLVVVPSAALRPDPFYAQYEPNSATPQNNAFIADAIQQAYQRSARAAPSPTPAPTSPPTPPPATPAVPTSPPTPPPATPTPAPSASPAPSAPPARSFPAGLALAALIIILVAVIVGARMRMRKPPPEATPSVGMGREEVPPEPLVPPPPVEPPPSPS